MTTTVIVATKSLVAIILLPSSSISTRRCESAADGEVTDSAAFPSSDGQDALNALFLRKETCQNETVTHKYSGE